MLYKSVTLSDDKRNSRSLVLDPNSLENGYIEIPEKFKKCIDDKNAPKSIRDLTSGLTIDSYTFTKEDQVELGYLHIGGYAYPNSNFESIFHFF